MDVNTAKLLTMLLTGGVSFLVSLIPLFLGSLWSHHHSRRSRIILSALLCFGGGILFASSIVHMLPEVREGVRAVVETEMPLAEMTFVAGFFLVYLIEEAVISVCGETNTSHDHGYSHGGPSIVDNEVADTKVMTVVAVANFLTVLALSLHAVFEGLAVGLADEVDDVWVLFFAIASHKYVIAFCVGMELVASRTNKIVFMLYMILWCGMSPLGIAGGMFLNDYKEGSSIVTGTAAILEGMAGGTLVYVMMFEILERERAKRDVPGLVKFFATLIGCALMITANVLMPHGHDHGGDDHDDHGHHHDDHPHRHSDTTMMSTLHRLFIKQ